MTLDQWLITAQGVLGFFAGVCLVGVCLWFAGDDDHTID